MTEEQGATSSHQETAASASSEAEANRVLDALEKKTNNCSDITSDDMRTLNTFGGDIEWTFEGYVSFACTVEEGHLVMGRAKMETRAGWSSADGNFTESAFEGSAVVEIPLKAVSLEGAITQSVTVRQTGLEVKESAETQVSVGVTKDLGIVEGEAKVSFNGKSVSIEGGVSAALPINVTDCNGEESVGFTLKLDAERVTTSSPAIVRRAGNIVRRNQQNISFYRDLGLTTDHKKLQRDCCERFNTCQ